MLKRIYIHNFRTFVNFEWRPPPACVLVGANGSGKSALMEVMILIYNLVVDGRRIEETGFPSTLTVWTGEPEQVIEIDVALDGETYQYRVACRHENHVSSISEQLMGNGDLLYRSGPDGIELFGDKPSAPRTRIPLIPKTSFLASLEPGSDNRRITQFKDYIAGLKALKPDPLRLSAAAAAEALQLAYDLTNFASWYRTRVQEDPDAVVALREDLQRALGGFDQIRLQALPGGMKDPLVRFKVGKNSHELDWGRLSDGQRMLIALYAVYRLALPTASLVILDEVENFVAPAEIQPWLREVVDLIAAKNRQLIVISHHPESINYLAADAIWHMWREHGNGHTRIAPLKLDREHGAAAYDATKAEAANA